MPIGLALSVALLYIAWDHNPQEAFHGEAGTNWSSLAWLASASFATGTVAAFVGFFAISWYSLELLVTRDTPR